MMKMTYSTTSNHASSGQPDQFITQFVCLFTSWYARSEKFCQFSLGNSFWIHPLVQLLLCIFGAWYPVSFLWRGPPGEGGFHLRYGGSDDIVMILPRYVMSCHDIGYVMSCHCHAMISGMWCHAIVMPWYRMYVVRSAISSSSCHDVVMHHDVMPWYHCNVFLIFHVSLSNLYSWLLIVVPSIEINRA